MWTTSMQLNFNLEFEIWKYGIWASEYLEQVTYDNKSVNLPHYIKDVHAFMLIVNKFNMN
jgi:hypothetical protein